MRRVITNIPFARRVAASLVLSASTMAMTAPVSANGGPSPLSGRPGGEGKPVVMVKYGNARPDRPHYGLNQADLIYVEEVEWGLTRIAAMFNTKIPSVAGPTRSARISDLEILEQFDSPGLVFSGANDVLLKAVRKSNAISLSPSERSNFYYRNLSKEAPHNQLVRLASLMKKEGKVGSAKDVGFVFDRAVPAGGVKAATFRASWPSALVSGRWTKSGWQISFDGSLHRDAQTKGLLTPRTVVLQYAEHKESAYGDRFGGKTPLVKTVGSGRATVLRNGQKFDAEWTRASAGAGTTFTMSGVVLPFDVGQVLVVLVDEKAKKGTVSVGG
jgi:hypothetical protein